ncbi:hypothetical protein GGI07_002898 [Coemansia sp. Benny D115]|nr:hypothetical protein GGI07_002898 [Coemansia sp. Benny D115]
MDNNESRAWPKPPAAAGSPSAPQQTSQSHSMLHHQTTASQRAIPAHAPQAGSAPTAPAQLHRYNSGPLNQLPPIQSPMSPKADASSSVAATGTRPYAHSISHSSPASATGVVSAPLSARPPSYGSTPHSTHSQSPYAVPGMSPNPASAASSASGPAPVSAGNPLPAISGGFVRSPTFSNAQSSSVPPMKPAVPQPQMQSQPQPHAALSSPHGPASGAPVPHDTPPVSSAGASTGGYSGTTHAPVARLHASTVLSSPGARVAQPMMHSPHTQHTASVPPPKQLQSPNVHRSGSAQSTPAIPAILQSSPRPISHMSAAPSAGIPAPTAGAGATFAGNQRSATGQPAPSSAATVGAPQVARPAAPPVSAGTPLAQVAAQGPPQAPPQGSVAATAEQRPPAADAGVSARPLNVSDALSYLDLVKSRFHDRPEVYNQFLEIMKEFKSHAIDTPGVIERVSRLFYGSPGLIQGFNTFLPPGYRIECSDDPADGVRVTTPSGSVIPDMHRRAGSAAAPAPQSPLSQQQQAIPRMPAQQQQQQTQQQLQQTSQHYASRDTPAARRAASTAASGNAGTAPGHAMQSPGLAHAGASAATMASASAAAVTGQGAADGRPPSAVGSPGVAVAARARQVPMEFNHAINYVNKIKMRFAAEPDRYKEFLDILQTYQKEARPIQEVYAQVQVLFASAPDLLDEFKQFLPDTNESAGAAAAGQNTSAAVATSPGTAYARAGVVAAPGQMPGAMAPSDTYVAGGRLPPVGNFTPVGTSSHGTDPFAHAPTSAGSTSSAIVAGSGSAPLSANASAPQSAGAASYDGKGLAGTPTSGRKRRSGASGSAQVPGGPGAAKRRSKGVKADGSLGDAHMLPQQAAASAAAAAGYAQHMPTAVQAADPATATPDELAFFERVKRFIGQPSAYTEFLKLLNLYNQQILDPVTLVERAESFIGDDAELFGWFRQFVGFDERQLAMEDSRSGDEAIVDAIVGAEPGPYETPEEVAKSLRPARPKADLTRCKAYGPSYRLLPEASARARCSGRDAMCYEVLNDRWASHPTWASEDTEFVHHKKNAFEEAMFRTEEDRHEMDIEIDTNLSVIRQLTPVAQRIEQLPPDKQMQQTLPKDFWGLSEALPRRALRKVYDSTRALEIIKAMHTHPAVAIPIVLRRLKQKDEEWRRQRREYSKVWREADAKNYYRALDHQGLTFKSADRKNISPKQLVAEIEARRREQQNLSEDAGARSQSRRVAAALRHRYQLEYRFTEPAVIADVVNAILAHVGRSSSPFSQSEKEAMEKFFHDVFGGFFGIDGIGPLHSTNSAMSETAGDGDADADGDAEVEVEVETREPNGVSSLFADKKADDAQQADKNGNAGNSSEGAGTAAPLETAAEEKPKIDSNTEQATSSNAMDVEQPVQSLDKNGVAPAGSVNGVHAADDAESKPSTPGLISSRSWIQIGSNKRDASAAPTASSMSKSVSRAFYTNSNYYVFLRLFQILYERFNRLRELGPECQARAQQSFQAQSVASKLGMRPHPEVLKDYDLETTEYYTIFLELVEQFLQGQLETNSFDEAMRVMYGINAYKILTVDKVVQAISKNIQHLVSDTRCIDILELFGSIPPVHELSPLRSHIAYRMKVEALVGADEHVFRVDYIYDSQTMAIQLLRREDITLDEAVTEEERWAYYVDSYVLFEPTEGVGRSTQTRPRPYLSRHLHPDEGDYAISSRAKLEIKIAVNTYKLCFLTGTEDIYANHSRRGLLSSGASKEAKEAYEKQWEERSRKWHEWVAQEHQEHQVDEGSGELVEWWK